MTAAACRRVALGLALGLALGALAGCGIKGEPVAPNGANKSPGGTYKSAQIGSDGFGATLLDRN